MLRLLLCSAAVLVSCARAQELQLTASASQTCSGYPGVETRRFHVANYRTEPLFVMSLGKAPQIRFHCVHFTETPQVAACDVASVPRLCQQSSSTGICRTLTEYAYNAEKVSTFGEVTDAPVSWVLLWDPRGKPSQCYPRDITVSAAYELRDQNAGSTALAIIAIVVTVVLVIVVAAFVLAQLLERVRVQKKKQMAELEARRRAESKRRLDWEGDPDVPTLDSTSADHVAIEADDRGLPAGAGRGLPVADDTEPCAPAPPPPQLQEEQTPPAAGFRPQTRGGFTTAQVAGRALSTSASPARDIGGDVPMTVAAPGQSWRHGPSPFGGSPENPLTHAFPQHLARVGEPAPAAPPDLSGAVFGTPYG